MYLFFWCKYVLQSDGRSLHPPVLLGLSKTIRNLFTTDDHELEVKIQDELVQTNLPFGICED